MYPAYLIRTSIDWVRKSEEFKESNPYSRCQESVNLCQQLWEAQYGTADLHLVEPNVISAYWAEFFHAPDTLADETEWRESLTAKSHEYDNFEQWQEWFKQTYSKVYKDDWIWAGVLATAWAHTHQYDVIAAEDTWEFRPASSYLETSELWRLEPHIDLASEILEELWGEEVAAYEKMGFAIEKENVHYLGAVECLGFDVKRTLAVWPARAGRQKEEIRLGQMVADIVLPAGDNWYRQLDSTAFAHDYVDVTALMNRARYVFGSRRRLFELTIDHTPEQARMQASAEGWLVNELEGSAV